MTDFDTASLVLPVPEHWPVPPKKPAFHGLAGDLAMAAEPYTEADPVAILVQFLVAFGNRRRPRPAPEQRVRGHRRHIVEGPQGHQVSTSSR